MQQIPEQQINQRWISLPPNLKEAIFSESNTDIVWRIGGEKELDEKRIKILTTIVGDIILGFLSLDDFTAQIKNDLGLDAQIANSISQEISQKIFEPIADEIKKNYAPPAKVNPFIHPPDHPMPEPLPHEGEFSHLKYQELRATGQRNTKTEKRGDNALDSSPAEQAQNDGVPTASSLTEATKDTQNDPDAKPFILHQEESNFDSGESDTLNQMPKINISQFEGEEMRVETKPVARVEIGSAVANRLQTTDYSPNRETEERKNLRTKELKNLQPEIRLVHFSSFCTPVAVWGDSGPRDPNPFKNHLELKKPDNVHQLPPIIPRNVEQLRQRSLSVKPLVRSPRIVPPPVRHVSITEKLGAKVEGNTVYI